MKKQKFAQLHPALREHFAHLVCRSANRFRTQLESELFRFGLTPPMLAILTIVQASKSLSQHDLGRYLEIDKASMVKFIDILENAKLLKRCANHDDRRLKMIQVSAKGEAFIKRMHRRYKKMEDDFLQPLGANDRKKLLALLEKLLSPSEVKVSKSKSAGRRQQKTNSRFRSSATSLFQAN